MGSSKVEVERSRSRPSSISRFTGRDGIITVYILVHMHAHAYLYEMRELEAKKMGKKRSKIRLLNTRVRLYITDRDENKCIQMKACKNQQKIINLLKTKL